MRPSRRPSEDLGRRAAGQAGPRCSGPLGRLPPTGASGADTEGERHRLAERVAAYQRHEVEPLAELGRGHDRLASDSDLWTAGVNVADLLDEDGGIDVGKAHAAVTAVLAERPH